MRIDNISIFGVSSIRSGWLLDVAKAREETPSGVLLFPLLITLGCYCLEISTQYPSLDLAMRAIKNQNL